MSEREPTASPNQLNAAFSTRAVDGAAIRSWSERAIAIGIALAFATIGVIAIVSYRAIDRVVSDAASVVHTREVLQASEDLRATLTQGQSVYRGYAATINERFLQPFTTAAEHVDGQVARLRHLTADNPEQQHRLDALEPLIASLLVFGRQVMETTKAQGLGSAAELLTTGRGLTLMDEISALLGELNADEESLLAVRTAASRASRQQTMVAFFGLTALALAMLCTVAFVTTRDISRRKRAETALRRGRDELAERTAELARSNAELEQFASVTSHDLQEPLRKIQSFGERLQSKYSATLPADAADYIERMRNAAARMQAMINDLLALARVTTMAQPFVAVDLSAAARDAVADLETRIERTGGHVDIAPLPNIEADPMQMRLLMMNLIGNALKFHRSDTPPVVRVYAGNNAEATPANGSSTAATIVVADNGIGFDEQYRERIFGMFQRLHGRSEYEGSGIGLAICAKIAARHGGTIAAHSQPGEGATFIVTLPVRQMATSAGGSQ